MKHDVVPVFCKAIDMRSWPPAPCGGAATVPLSADPAHPPPDGDLGLETVVVDSVGAGVGVSDDPEGGGPAFEVVGDPDGIRGDRPVTAVSEPELQAAAAQEMIASTAGTTILTAAALPG